MVLRAPGSGRVSVVLDHTANSKMLAYATSASYRCSTTAPDPARTGRFVQLVQQQLAALHLYIPQTGVYDQGTELALDAYHRLLGKGEGHMTLDPATLTDLLNGVGSFHVRYPNQGSHAEGDLSDQVLALHRRLDRSTGSSRSARASRRRRRSSATTRSICKQPGYLPDGMYYSDFFIGGYAIHGYDPAPDYPASHGCMRLPIVDAIPALRLDPDRATGSTPTTPECRRLTHTPTRASGCCARCATKRS